MFGLGRYLRDCGKFKICNFIFMDYALGNCSKGFGDNTVFGMYLGIFEAYRVDLLKKFTDNN